MRGTESYERAALLLTGALRAEALFQPDENRRLAEELRLRCGLGACLRLPGQTVHFHTPVGREEIEETLERATKSSFYAAEESLRSGYFTAEGGLRLGLGGSLLLRKGEPVGFRTVSSISIRIPHAVSCVTDELLCRLEGKSVLIYSPPGGGKTTFLRDLVRRISDGGQRVSLVDERGELAALWEGVPQFDVGRNTDVIEGCPKLHAAEMLLRTMSPQVLAVDELSSGEMPLLSSGLAAGVQLLATAHAADLGELCRRGVGSGRFSLAVGIGRSGGERRYRVEELPC